jgi:hypothetical protein
VQGYLHEKISSSEVILVSELIKTAVSALFVLSDSPNSPGT